MVKDGERKSCFRVDRTKQNVKKNNKTHTNEEMQMQ